MVANFFSSVYDFISRNRNKTFLSLFFLVLASLTGLFFVNFNSNIGVMIPNHPTIVKDMEFFRSSNMSNKVLISISLTSPEKNKDDLIKATDDIVSALSPDFFSKVSTGVADFEIDEMMDKLILNLSKTVSPGDLGAIDSRINSEYVSDRLAEDYRQLIGPGGIFFNSVVRSDPLGLKFIMLKKLQSLSSSLGYDLRIDNGRFLSKDSRNAMIIAEATVPLTDIRGSEKLYNHLSAVFAKVPDYISISQIAGHFHTFSNEKVIKRDISLTLTIASIGFLILILVIIGDQRSLLIYIIPLIAVLFSINISYLILGELSYSVIGLGSVIAGISIDYGIHVYIAAITEGDPSRGAKLVAKPLAIGALTTIGVFFTFFFSHIAGYHQLAVFSIISVLLALLISMFILPQFIIPTDKGRGLKRLHGKKLEELEFSNPVTVVIWALLTSILLIFAFNARFESDIRKVDGTEKNIIESENRFKKIWGSKKLAILVVYEKNLQTALKLNEMIYSDAVKIVGEENISSLAPLWPSRETRKENLARWSEFWQGGREEKLKNLLLKEGEKFQFAQSAFDPFFETLKASYDALDGEGKSTGDESITDIYGRFVNKIDGGYQLLTFFPDDEKVAKQVEKISGRYPASFLVSRTIMDKLFAEVFMSDVKILTNVAILLVVSLTFFFLRNVRETVIALIPVAASTIWILGILTLFGHSLNVAAMVAYIVVMGLCVDYGIFMTYKSRVDLKAGTVLAVTLSAVSTILGAGVLIFARHPALFSTGATMLIGVGAGYISSILVIPYLYNLLMGKTETKRSTR